jgi:hypothetical protein
MIAQQLAFENADMVRWMILLGTGPRGGEGMTLPDSRSTNWPTQQRCS